jgi:hypothetical protein
MKTTETYYILKVKKRNGQERKGEYKAIKVIGDLFADLWREVVYSEPYVEADNVCRFYDVEEAKKAAGSAYLVVEVKETTQITRRICEIKPCRC